MQEKAKEKPVALEGEISRRPAGRLLRFILAVTGIAFLKAVVGFVSTYVLGFRRRGRVTAEGSLISIDVESYMMGRRVRRSRTHIPFRSVVFIRKDESLGVMPVLGAALGLMAGLALGFIFLVQWSMTLLGIYIIVGFACVLVGASIDLLVSFIIPRLRGRSTFVFATRSDVYRLRNVPVEQVEGFMDRWSNLLVVK
jgi:hypothetical protein